MNSVLVIGYVWPEPQSSAAGSHMMSLLRLFKKQAWHVTFASPAQSSEYMEDLVSEGIDSESIPLNDSQFDQFVSELNPDIVLFDRFMMEEQFGWRVELACPKAIRILDTEDLQCLRQARNSAHKENRLIRQSDFHSDLAKREIAAIWRSDLSLIISSYELDLLQKQFGVDPQQLHHLPFMIEDVNRAQGSLSYEERVDFVTIGNFRHAPNWDSVLFLQEIWPQIRKQLPKAELNIYGSYPPPKATALDNPKLGFRIKGRATSALEVMERARVCLAPLRFGAGIKGKLIDAMLAETPSVTTSIGIEGMADGHSWPGLVADSALEIANAAVRLYSDKALWSTVQPRTKAILSSVYDAKKLGTGLITRLEDVQKNLVLYRIQNFTGAMLRHHHQRSTEFMSRWIELKNKLGKT